MFPLSGGLGKKLLAPCFLGFCSHFKVILKIKKRGKQEENCWVESGQSF
jgi:hypothetical protein